MRKAPGRPARFLQISHLIALLVLALVVALSITGFVWAQKGVTVVVDGESHFMKTQADTVALLLAEADIAVDSADLVTPAPDETVVDGMSVVVRHSIPVKLVLAGETLELDVVGSSVADALVAAGADPTAGLAVEPALDSQLEPGMTITACDVFVRVLEEEICIPFKTVTRNDASLAYGQRKVVSAGVVGKNLRIYQAVVSDGREGARTLKDERVVTAPIDQVVAVGTKRSATPVVQSAATVKAAAAPKGGTQLRVVTTAYAPGSDGVDHTTATGARAGFGIIAVDPRVIRLGTRLYIPGYGYGIAADTGGAIKGNKIDLCFNTRGEALAWGRRTVTITILP